MTSFSFAVQSICLVVLTALLVYTLALMRTGRLNAHVTVRWVLAEVAAIGAVLLWGRLPVIAYTSTLGDRELLVVLAVLFFGFIAFLMLDSLQRISAQSAQVRRLTQELALLREQVGHSGSGARTEVAAEVGLPPMPERTRPGPLATVLIAVWISACVATLAVESQDGLPRWVMALLTARYKQ